jgi:hypothetical protein
MNHKEKRPKCSNDYVSAKSESKRGTAVRPDDAASSLSIWLFGPFEVRLGDQPLPCLRFRKSPAILALPRCDRQITTRVMAFVGTGYWLRTTSWFNYTAGNS